MAKVNKRKLLGKALSRGLQYGLVAAVAMTTVPVPEGVGVSQQATTGFVIGIIGAICKGIHNYKKTKNKEQNLSGY